MPQHDSGLADVLDQPGVRDLGIVARHDDRHPVSKLAVDDPDTVARKLRDAFPHTGYWPLLLLDDIELPPDITDMLARGWRREDLVTGAEAVAVAADMTIDDATYGKPADPVVPPPDLAPRPEEAAELGQGWTSREPALLVVRTQAPWESLAHIGFGLFNESGADPRHVRFHRYLWESCQGVVTAVGTSRMNISLPGRPLDPATAFELADRIFYYCNDMETVLADRLYADPDEEDFAVLLAGMLTAGLSALPLWWD